MTAAYRGTIETSPGADTLEPGKRRRADFPVRSNVDTLSGVTQLISAGKVRMLLRTGESARRQIDERK
jgi:hypothetical protein